MQPHDDMPPVTDAHRRAAFCAMRWVGWTFDAAVADPVRHHVSEQELYQFDADETLHNNGTIQDLYNLVSRMLGKTVTT